MMQFMYEGNSANGSETMPIVPLGTEDLSAGITEQGDGVISPSIVSSLWENYDADPQNRVFFEAECRTVIGALALFAETDRTIQMLDVGSGTGRYTTQAKKLGAEVVGIDIDETMLQQAREKDPEIPYFLADVSEGLPVEWDGRFDRVNISHVLKFIADPDKKKRQEKLVRVFQNVSKVLRPGGILVFSEISNATNDETWKIVADMENIYRCAIQQNEIVVSEEDSEISLVKHSESFLRECLAEAGFSMDIQHVYTDGVVRNPLETSNTGAQPLIAVYTCKKIK